MSIPVPPAAQQILHAFKNMEENIAADIAGAAAEAVKAGAESSGLCLCLNRPKGVSLMPGT